jgi:predicted PurR-regulated permease PerM
MDRKQNVLIGVSAVLFLGSCVLFWPVARTLLFAATLSVVLVPPMTRLEARLWGAEGRSGRHAFMSLAVTLATLAALLLAVALVVFIFVRNFEVLEDFGTQVAARVEETAQNLLGTPFDLQARATESLDQLLGYVRGTFVVAAGMLVDLVIFASALFLFLRHGNRLREALREALPGPRQHLFDRFAGVTHSSLYAIYVVHVATALITVVLAVPFFYLIGFGEHVLFWSFLCGSFQLVPVLGPSLIMVAIAIYGFSQGDSTTGLLVLFVGYPVVAALPDFFFRPFLLRTRMKIEAAVLILGFFAGIVSVGMIGFVLGPLMLKLLVEALRLTREELVESPS